MARKIKFGARIPNSGPTSSVQRLIESTEEAENLGYDSVWGNDHIHNSHERHKHYPLGMGLYTDPSNTLDPNHFEIISTFSFLAGMTRNVRFGAGIMPILLRDPIVLAKEVATLDALSDSRFILGVGVSNISDTQEFKAVGKSFLKYEERYRMLSEYIGAMKTIWENETASFHGKYVNFDDLTIYPKPARKHSPPIWAGSYTLAGGIGRPAVRFALEHADGWIYGFLMTPSVLKSMIEDFAKTAKETRRDISNFDWCFQMRLSIGATDEVARINCDWIPQEQLETSTVGMPTKILKRVEEFVNAGANYFDLWFIYPRYGVLLDQMKIFAKEVMPSFN